MSPYEAKLATLDGVRGIGRSGIEWLARHAEFVEVPSGQPLFSPADRWTGAYVLASGEASIEAPGWNVSVGPGTRLTRYQPRACQIAVYARTDIAVLEVDPRAVGALAEALALR